MTPATWKTLAPGVYLLEGPEGVREVVMICVDGSVVGGERRICHQWLKESREATPHVLALITCLRPLERHGGLSCMYWGDEIR